MEIIAKIHLPSILFNLLLLPNYFEVFPQLLKSAPPCVKDLKSDHESWNRSLVAPLILVCSVDQRLYYKPELKAQPHNYSLKLDKNLKNFIDQMAMSLKLRSDSDFLASNLQFEIQKRKFFRPKKSNKILKLMGTSLRKAFPLPLNTTFEDLIKTCFQLEPNEAYDIFSNFVQTGKLQEERKKINLINLASKLAFVKNLSPKQAEIFLKAFELLLCFEDFGLFTNDDFKLLDGRHKAIANIYLALPNPVLK